MQSTRKIERLDREAIVIPKHHLLIYKPDLNVNIHNLKSSNSNRRERIAAIDVYQNTETANIIINLDTKYRTKDVQHRIHN